MNPKIPVKLLLKTIDKIGNKVLKLKEELDDQQLRITRKKEENLNGAQKGIQGLGKKLGRKLGGKAISKVAGGALGKSLGKKIPLLPHFL